MNTFLPATPVAVPLTVAAVLAAVNQHIARRLADALAIAASLWCLSACLMLMFRSNHGLIVYWMGGWQPRNGAAIGISFAIDPIGAGAAAFASFLVLVAFVFSAHYFDSVGTLFHVLLLAFLAAMCGFSLTGDIFNLFVFFELMSAAAFALCGYKTEESGPIQGALNFAITNTIGAFLALSGVGLLYGRTGALNMAQIGKSLGQTHDGLVVAAFVMITCGFLVKAAVVPFHFWLADAHAVAPTPVCVLFSGIMVELGLYAVARVYWTIFHGALAQFEAQTRAIFVTVGVITAVIGAFMCFAQRHIKRLLAYSTISHTGLMLIAFAMLAHGALAGLALYVIGHGLLKGALFLAAGMLLHHLGSIDELKLRGKGREAIAASGLMLFLALGLSGVPPYGTFLGEALIDSSAEKLHYSWISYIFMLAGIITAAAVLRVVGRVYFGWGEDLDRSQQEEGETDEGRETSGGEEIPATMFVPTLVLLLMGLSVTFIPGLRNETQTAAMRFMDQGAYQQQVLQHAAPPQYQPPAEESLLVPIIRGLVATFLALIMAGLVLLPHPLRKGINGFSGGISYILRPIRIVHSGHMGDYVAWLTAGVAVIGGLFAYFIH
ncbi:MAG TPA: proton-conducting transporter membrane subunit [Candidatus Acidoferrales bacterium]|jgi:multicomponent Na+:H+ antiporter subunit D|nr:proton-conducting transporter membrane subunit [Candidatus Acidoferrales bacterium]